jgi:ATP-dependent DNA helicase RecQ
MERGEMQRDVGPRADYTGGVSDLLDVALKERFGLSALKPWQREAIEGVLEGPRRALVIAPTGGGKSLTYQLPATLLPSTSVVISPLVALMDDQVRALEARGIGATYLASTLSPEERRARQDRLAAGAIKLLYVAPERLATPGAIEQLARLRPPLVAIDEAHCISQWGHDFRPDYLRLGEVLKKLAPAHAVACTATATPRVRDEILEKLGWAGATTRLVLRGFARPNLHLSALEVGRTKERRAQLTAALKEALGPSKKTDGAAIVYCATRRAAEDAGVHLRTLGYRAAVYHAGLSPDERTAVSERFSDRTLDVVAATNAFGMGIDRPDIRLVVHMQMPSSIEAYYQEVGRAGRDGQPAWGVVFSGASDLATRKRLIEMGTLSAERVKQQWSLFLDLCRYVEAGSCRHDFILRYFGDEAELLGGCGHCDVCETLQEKGQRGSEPDEEAELTVKKALSAVARARGGAGLNAIARSLAGETAKGAAGARLAQLSTHGLLRALGVERATRLMRRLVTAGLVELTSGDYPVAILTERGASVMKGQQLARVLVPEGFSRAPKPSRTQRTEQAAAPTGMTAIEVQRLEALRLERTALAKSVGMPPYVVAHDSVLIDIAKSRPATLRTLGQIRGMGPARLDAYGERLLAALDRAERA